MPKRSSRELLDLYADNSTQNIEAKDLRDFVESSTLTTGHRDQIAEPVEGSTILEIDSGMTFTFTNGDWVQAGEQQILRAGLATGVLFVDKVIVG